MKTGKFSILTVPDVHGESFWKEAEDKMHLCDKIIFLGDYPDSFFLPDNIILENFLAIIRFRKENPDKVVLLLGNHDTHYIEPDNVDIRGSGFRRSMTKGINSIFNENSMLFTVAYQYKNYLWSHAGISGSWYRKRLMPVIKEYPALSKHLAKNELAEIINSVYASKNREILHDISGLRGGIHEHGGIFWADAEETSEDPHLGFHQIIGHTKLTERNVIRFDENTSIAFCETNQSVNRLFLLEIPV